MHTGSKVAGDPIRILQQKHHDGKTIPNPIKTSTENVTVSWQPPEMGWMKLNTDGACQNGNRQMGVGGLIRNENGVWIRGFMGRVGYVLL